MIDHCDQHIGGEVITMEMYEYVRFSHYKLGQSIRKIHRQTGLDRQTIRKALAGLIKKNSALHIKITSICQERF